MSVISGYQSPYALQLLRRGRTTSRLRIRPLGEYLRLLAFRLVASSWPCAVHLEPTRETSLAHDEALDPVVELGRLLEYPRAIAQKNACVHRTPCITRWIGGVEVTPAANDRVEALKRFFSTSMNGVFTHRLRMREGFIECHFAVRYVPYVGSCVHQLPTSKISSSTAHH